VLGSTRYGRGGEDGEELGGLGDTTRTLPADYLAALMALFLLMVADRTVSSASVVTAACCWPIGDCSNGMKDFHSTFCIRFPGAQLLLLCCPMCMCSNTHLLYVLQVYTLGSCRAKLFLHLLSIALILPWCLVLAWAPTIAPSAGRHLRVFLLLRAVGWILSRCQ
jgi:hypothetical protein